MSHLNRDGHETYMDVLSMLMSHRMAKRLNIFIMEYFARTCSVTGEGMNEGWCWGDGSFYTKDKDVTIKELRTDYPEHSDLSDDDLLTWAVEDEDILYWTEWYDEDEDEVN